VRGYIKTLVVDDESIARRVLREELESFPEVQVLGEAESGLDALNQILNLQPDLVFLDLQMPGMGGFEMIQNMTGLRPPVVVIVTAFHQHAVEAFDAGAADYLLKPVRRERLQKAIERARELIARNPPLNKMVGRVGREYFLLDYDEILALQAEGELVWIITPTRRFLAGQTLRAIEEHLLPSSFQRVHRGAIVNVKHVRKLSALSSYRWLITLSNDSQIVVSKRRAQSIRRMLWS
jgi:two-component system LytT family response regulator